MHLNKILGRIWCLPVPLKSRTDNIKLFPLRKLHFASGIGLGAGGEVGVPEIESNSRSWRAVQNQIHDTISWLWWNLALTERVVPSC